MTLVPYPDFPAALQDQLEKVVACSPFAAGLISRYPVEFEDLIKSGRLVDDKLEELSIETSSTDFDSMLRKFRNQAMLGIIWRDLNGLSTLEESLEDLTRLAEVCIHRALGHHNEILSGRHGEPEGQRLIVLAMGKLGGRELNLSSDVDLVFVFPHDGETTGKRKLSYSEYFTRLTRAVITTLSEQTEHGFVFRVDTRLRPYGDSGPLVVSEAAIEQYYQREGREWERYALIKARPIAGDIQAGEKLLARLRPFVYRRYVDFGVFESLREMAQKLGDEANRRGWETDIKRGPGGIREAEFFIQSFQLLRGGKEPALQTNSFFNATQAVADLNMVERSVIEEITSGYSYLRTLENRLQALHDQQTHTLPESKADQQALTAAMNETSWVALCKTQERHRQTIRTIFHTLARPVPGSETEKQGTDLWNILTNQDAPLESVLSAICSDTDASTDHLSSFRRFLARSSLSQRAHLRLERAMPLLLDRLVQKPLPSKPLSQVLDLVRSISRRSAYLVLLSENPIVLDRLLGFFTKSPWIADQVVRYPLLLDELIDPRLSTELSGREALAKTLSHTVKPGLDEGQHLIALNEFKLGIVLRIAIAELENKIDVCTAQRLLTDLAEVLIERVLHMAITALEGRFRNTGDIKLGVIAYGTLGARELGYESDLDLVFLYQLPDCLPDSGDADRYAIRLSQRLLTYMSSQTAAGSLYLVDTRLRPNGNSGFLVSTLESFRHYQEKEAWTWEQQALTRARWITGSASINPAFESIRKTICTGARDETKLKNELVSMRERIRDQKYDAGKRNLDFKNGPGGLLDIEFIAQYCVLKNATGTPQLLQSTNTLEQIRTLRDLDFLVADVAATLEDAWLAFSRARHFAALTDARDIGTLESHMNSVRDIWLRLFNTEQGTPAS